jgi:uncharacterized peroxidase-related enzyme
MRLEVLNNGYGPAARMLFAFVRMVSGRAMPDAARLVFYRPDFYGSRMKELTHQVMRGASAWSVADRELMAAYVSTVNHCAFCIGAHTATASLARKDPAAVAAALSDVDSAPIDERLRATLRMLGKLGREHSVTEGDMRALLESGVSEQQIEDALAVFFAFDVTNRLADAFGFEVLSSEGFAAGAKVLLSRGYR